MLNKLQEEAVNLAITGHNLFINGPAGTGKTYTIKEVYHRLTALGKSVAITCTTGIACTNFDNACTLHRWSGINDGRYSSSEIVNILLSNEGALHRIRSTDVLIIDEVSMLSKKLFEQLVSIVTQLRDVIFSPTQNRVLAKREQVPLLLAYALTVHKAQGMTLDRVEVNCQQMYRPGQLGVAMGRVRSSDGLRVINFTPKVCIPQPDEIKGYLTMPYVEPADDFNCCTNISG
ncbi:uncharacterized protein LOC128549396 [Mercenaria mercenaria]|uniref:uncharacterized protein LOC128549396 n=1 Tax=Mercenaria mercenaria TaxID=6596 RepID=UPI00234FAF9E|nr:uncharacterized protein LOC128549396 [Mercenaria mercenaria]